MKGTALKLYTRTVTAVGGAVVLYSLAALARMPHPLEWFLFAVLAILTASFTIKIAGCEASVAVDDTFFMVSAMLFGPGPAAVSLAADSCVLSWRKGHDWSRLAFNTVAPALSLWVGGQAFFVLGRVGPLSVSDAPMGPLLVPLLCLAAVYFVLNSGLMAIAVGLDSRQSPVKIWRHHFLWLSLSYFAAASVALGLVLVIKQVGLLAVAVILPVVAIFHRTLFASFGRLEDAHHHLKQMDRLYLSTVETLAMAIDAKDDVTHSHVRRVQAYAVGLARALGISDEPTIKAIEAAALLHDTGKLGVPEHILNKPGGLTAPEFEQMKRHVDIGADILSLVDFPYPVVPIVRCHHENWDGSGYPRGVTGEDIPIGARILSVVDCYDALTSDRPYRRALTDVAAIDILLERRGRMYDPRVVDTFIQIYRTIEASSADKTQQQHVVLEQISRSRKGAAPAVPPDASTVAPASAATAHANDNVLAFVSLSRLASGAGTLGDMLSLSTKLVRDLAPEVSGAWFMLNADCDQLTATESFGPSAEALRGRTIRVGDRLTGWVAANRQVIINSDPALDLGERAHDAPILRSCLSVPLMAGTTLVGVLSMYASERNAFTEDQGRLVQMVAPHVAVGLDVARRRSEQPQIQTPRDFKLVAAR